MTYSYRVLRPVLEILYTYHFSREGAVGLCICHSHQRKNENRLYFQRAETPYLIHPKKIPDGARQHILLIFYHSALTNMPSQRSNVIVTFITRKIVVISVETVVVIHLTEVSLLWVSNKTTQFYNSLVFILVAIATVSYHDSSVLIISLDMTSWMSRLILSVVHHTKRTNKTYLNGNA